MATHQCILDREHISVFRESVDVPKCTNVSDYLVMALALAAIMK